MNLLILSRKFDGVVGGVEKQVLELARQMQLRGHSITLVSLDSPEATTFYSFPKGIGWIKLGIGNPDEKASFNLRILRVLTIRRIIKEIDIDTVVGFQIGSFALVRLAAMGTGVRSVAAERNAPTLFDFIQNGWIKRIISFSILSLASVVSVQLGENKELYPRWLRSRITVNPNPILPVGIHEKTRSPTRDRKVILYVGRVTFQKNLEVLVRAISLLDSSPVLRIVGEGEELPRIKALAKSKKVMLESAKFTSKLSEYYLDADIFCLPSRWEGFPNVVGEALAHGLPVVGFADCAGIKSLVKDFATGVIAEGNDDAVSLAEALRIALNTDWNATLIRNSIGVYSMQSFADSWESTFFPRGKNG